MIYKISAIETCHYCHGSGTVYDTVPYGSTTAQMPSTCSCIEEQLPEEFDDYKDEIEVISTGWTGGDGPEFEYDYDIDPQTLEQFSNPTKY